MASNFEISCGLDWEYYVSGARCHVNGTSKQKKKIIIIWNL
jgi:hypothetical protein